MGLPFEEEEECDTRVTSEGPVPLTRALAYQTNSPVDEGGLPTQLVCLRGEGGLKEDRPIITK